MNLLTLRLFIDRFVSAIFHLSLVLDLQLSYLPIINCKNHSHVYKENIALQCCTLAAFVSAELMYIRGLVLLYTIHKFVYGNLSLLPLKFLIVTNVITGWLISF